MEGCKSEEYTKEANEYKKSHPNERAWAYTPEGGETIEQMNDRAADAFKVKNLWIVGPNVTLKS